jgi:cytochrome c
MRMKIAAACAVAIVASLLLAQVHPFGNAGLYAASLAQAPIMEHGNVPPDVRAILIAKCADCHTTQTHAPLYGRFAPTSWLMERDIVKGRNALNLSRWDTYAAERQQLLAAKIVQQASSHEMPLLQYRMIHWNARITSADTFAFKQWARELQAAGASSAADPAGAGDPDRGQDLFKRRCTGCHALTASGEGPRLHDVYGRSAGSVPGFAYSPAVNKAHLIWNDSTLEQWLTDPDTFVPGTNMDFRVPRPQERKDVISFLRREAGR